MQVLYKALYIYMKDILVLISDDLFMRAPLEWLLVNSLEADQYSSHTFFILMVTKNNYQIFAVASKFIYICCCQK